MYFTLDFIPNFSPSLLLLYIPHLICITHRLSVPTLSSRLTCITSQSSFDLSIIFAHASPPVLELGRVWNSRKLYMSSLDYFCNNPVLLLHQLI